MENKNSNKKDLSVISLLLTAFILFMYILTEIAIWFFKL